MIYYLFIASLLGLLVFSVAQSAVWGVAGFFVGFIIVTRKIEDV